MMQMLRADDQSLLCCHECCHAVEWAVQFLIIRGEEVIPHEVCLPCLRDTIKWAEGIVKNGH